MLSTRTSERARSRLSSIAVILVLAAAGGALWLATDEPPFPAAVADARASAPGSASAAIGAATGAALAAMSPAAPGNVDPAPRDAVAAPADKASAAVRQVVERTIAATGLRGAIGEKDRERIIAALGEIRGAARRGDVPPRRAGQQTDSRP